MTKGENREEDMTGNIGVEAATIMTENQENGGTVAAAREGVVNS